MAELLLPTHGNFLNLTGHAYGRLKVISYAGKKGGHHIWHCRCECGGNTISTTPNLRNGTASSCGCLRKETLSRKFKKHGLSHSPEHQAWNHAKMRCYNPRDTGYPFYGARGIIMCERWLHSLENFVADMGLRPSLKHSIDRIDNNGNYEPGNCRWATDVEQCRNRRSNRVITFNGRTACTAEWADILGINQQIIKDRLRRGWTEADALMPLAHPSSP